MTRVTGIGGIFFQARDPVALRAWYRRHLGIDVQPWGGAAIRASYIMEKSLTTEQAAELERALPVEFRRLDAEFHERALKLAMAAEARFPGLAPPAAEEHRH